MDDCCDMKGYLSFLVLRMISHNDLSGDDIRKELERRKGCMPSAGTIYPVLKDLKTKGLITETEQEGRTKRYTITDKGRKEVDAATKKFITLFSDLREDFKRG
jgi:PadR family transcriptional regulator, regulatory protein PadR